MFGNADDTTASKPTPLHTVAADCVPHVLCNYLFELAGAFMSFYETCPVLKAEPGTRDSRLLMCTLTADTLRTGLGVLGVEALDQM
ncbi:MAG TPA: DALR anticodon-binding domain-containing protein [Gammaproteobacteria bacterium]